MIRLKSVIIDDEFHGRKNLELLIKDYCPEIEVIGEADSGLHAKEVVLELNPDAVFLDISMPGFDGFDFLNSIPNHTFNVVFVTAHCEYGIKAIKAGAVDYLLKPICIDELRNAVKKLCEIKQNKELATPAKDCEKIILSKLNGFSIFSLNDITRLEGYQNYTKVYLINKKCVTVSRTLKYFECLLQNNMFIRIHKSHIINITYLKEYLKLDGYYAVMSDKSKLIISRRKVPEFLEVVKKYNLN